MSSKTTNATLPALGWRELRVRQDDAGKLWCTYYCTDTDGVPHVVKEYDLEDALTDPDCPLTPQQAAAFIAFMIADCDERAGFTGP